MAIGKIIVQHFGESLPFDQHEFEALQNRIDSDAANVGGRVGSVLNSPYLVIVLPFLLPILEQVFYWFADRFIPKPEQREDDTEYKQALQIVLQKMQQQ